MSPAGRRDRSRVSAVQGRCHRDDCACLPCSGSGGLEVDDKLEIRRLLDRQIASLHAFENFGHAASLDRPVCAKERQRWNRETQRAGDFEIDDERKARGLLDRNIAGFCTF